MKTKTEIKIRGYHIDFYNHVNNARYLEFFEEGRWDYFDGLLDSELGAIEKWRVVVVNININFRGSAKVGELVVVETELKKIGKKSFTLLQKCFVKNDNTVIADASVKIVVVDNKAQKAVVINDRITKILFGDKLTHEP